jgi:hypothetical protein
MDFRRINELTDELYQELKQNGSWDSLKIINNFAKAEYAQGLEDKINKLSSLLVAIDRVYLQREKALSRFKKLDSIHECSCSYCVEQREKFNVLLNQIEQSDNEIKLKDVLDTLLPKKQ